MKNLFKKGNKINLGRIPWNKGKKLSLAYRKKLSEAHKGQISWNKGKHPEYVQWENNPAWKGGIIKQRGYIYLRKPEHPFNHNEYVKRTRFVMEQHLSRYLTSQEIVHHINGIKDDDRLKNLKLCVNNSEHRKLHCR